MNIKKLLTTITLLCVLVTKLSFSAEELYFPDSNSDWETVAPNKVGWNQDLLNEALKLAGERKSSGVLILHNGRIMAERYWSEPDTSIRYKNFLQGFDSQNRAIEDVASAQKNITTVLVGMAQARGFLSLEDSVTSHLGAAWSKAPMPREAAITIYDLLTMTSGLASDLTYETEPGKKWLYNTPAYHFLMRVVSTATKTPREVLTREWLTSPLGMTSSSWTPRAWTGSDIGVGFSTTARDLARFGLFIQAGGRWDNEIIFRDSEFIEAMMKPAQDINPSYGYLWWLNGQAFSLGFTTQTVRHDGQLIPSAPDDLVAMQGALDRKLYLVPSLNLIVTRLGSNGSAGGQSFNEAFWEALMRAKQ